LPGLDRQIDPSTRDYVDAAGGEYAETLTMGTAIYHQMLTPLDGWCGDPTAGSALHLVKQKGSGAAGQIFAKGAVAAALKRFEDEGLLEDVEVTAKASANGRITMTTSAIDVGQGSLTVVAPAGEV
jgi:phage gp46-like protein